MLVGALADAGASQEALSDAIHSLGAGATVSFEKVKRRGIAATRFHVAGGEQKAHRHLPQIQRMIEAAALPGRAKQNALAVFQRLGEAEAAVHGIPLQKVHFHEVGAFDSIADIVGACYALELLGVEEIACSAINVGSGTVETEHGLLPVPAPATARLLEGKPVYAQGPATELTTPTGAAVVAALASHFGAMPPMTLLASGFGAGARDFPGQANVLRAVLGERSGAAETTTVAVLEANLDDLSPQVLAYAMDRLAEAGALDVSVQPLQMKKGRPGHLLRVLCEPQDRDRLAQLVFAETSTLGLRFYAAERRVQTRQWREVATPWGPVRIKVSGGGHFAPEYEDCRRLAEQRQVPLKQVLAEAARQYLNTLSQ
jgi:uncharacterized protein (TIGR00299 family) protein